MSRRRAGHFTSAQATQPLKKKYNPSSVHTPTDATRGAHHIAISSSAAVRTVATCRKDLGTWKVAEDALDKRYAREVRQQTGLAVLAVIYAVCAKIVEARSSRLLGKCRVGRRISDLSGGH